MALGLFKAHLKGLLRIRADLDVNGTDVHLGLLNGVMDLCGYRA